MFCVGKFPKTSLFFTCLTVVCQQKNGKFKLDNFISSAYPPSILSGTIETNIKQQKNGKTTTTISVKFPIRRFYFYYF